MTDQVEAGVGSTQARLGNKIEFPAAIDELVDRSFNYQPNQSCIQELALSLGEHVVRSDFSFEMQRYRIAHEHKYSSSTKWGEVARLPGIPYPATPDP